MSVCPLKERHKQRHGNVQREGQIQVSLSCRLQGYKPFAYLFLLLLPVERDYDWQDV